MISTDVNQVGVTLFPFFYHFTFPDFPFILIITFHFHLIHPSKFSFYHYVLLVLGVQESDLSLCQFVWETWGVNCPGSSQMALFDLNQWYKEQMPSKIIKGHASTYMTIFSLDDVVEGMLNTRNPLLDVRIDPASISQFTAVQSLEEHFYPSALSFESLSLLGKELVMVNHPGVQRDILSQLEQNGPNALLHPTKLFHHCIAIGLKPMYMDISSNNCLVVSAHSESL